MLPKTTLSTILNRTKTYPRSRPTYVRLSQDCISDIEILQTVFADLNPSQADCITMAVSALTDLMAGVRSGRISVEALHDILNISHG